MIYAKIDQKIGMVYFMDDPEEYNSLEMLEIINKKVASFNFHRVDGM